MKQNYVIKDESRYELPNQKLTNQLFLFKGKLDLDGKLFENIMLIKMLMQLKTI